MATSPLGSKAAVKRGDTLAQAKLQVSNQAVVGVGAALRKRDKKPFVPFTRPAGATLNVVAKPKIAATPAPEPKISPSKKPKK